MTEQSTDLGVTTVLLERLTKFRLPRLMELKAKVERGERLADFDLSYLQDVLADASQARPLIARHPELEEIAARLVGLYHQITSKALENEGGATGSGSAPGGLG
ncbi:MAG: hypothetical protein EA400_10730 [Chromatiaceae bacterium]|nr:MAG: hypothetical protein EA400_10730 [Chromatiaceae bacterium]